ncbi:hypothetical protein HYPSUDRAFT_36347 [Hypholoma sublateritium FD-334 SS-4]|uniref:Uncharacterized protein n=1 Tax=Hypholoma sublateritium (strain FD-334 SS-4) TaxID=945553 RepID=A0A0D2Q4Z6_HYPSF|nr:hypothetical protein HYPSUDRAFT_36347 [Hypholoma sublateritium FD-334 SS-4]
MVHPLMSPGLPPDSPHAAHFEFLAALGEAPINSINRSREYERASPAPTLESDAESESDIEEAFELLPAVPRERDHQHAHAAPPSESDAAHAPMKMTLRTTRDLCCSACCASLIWGISTGACSAVRT